MARAERHPPERNTTTHRTYRNQVLTIAFANPMP